MYKRQCIGYKAPQEFLRTGSPGAVVAQLLTNLRPEARPWIEKLKQRGVATLYSVSQFPSWPAKPHKRWFRGPGYRRVYNSFDALVTNSPAIKDFLQDIGVTTRVEYIPNGVNLERFRPADTPELEQARQQLRDKLGIAPGHKVIATVGAVMPRKGPELAIEAWNSLLESHPDTHLLLVGPRADRHDDKLSAFGAKLDALVRGSTKPHQVHFAGQVDDVEAWLRAADLFVLPTNREGTPNSVLEALATGLPSVVTDFTGRSAAIGTPGREYQLVERNAAAIAGALGGLLSEPGARVRWSAAGLDYIRSRMDVQVSLDTYADLYRELGQEALARR